MKNTFFHFMATCACVVTLTACNTVQTIQLSRESFHENGGVTLQLCKDPNLEACEFVYDLDEDGNRTAPLYVRNEMKEFDVFNLPASLQKDELSSFSMSCGRPTDIILYSHCNHTGDVAIYHCAPGDGKKVGKIDVPLLGNLANSVESIVISDVSEGPVNEHVLIPFESADVQAIGDAINARIMSAGGEGISTYTRLYWTKGLNIQNEKPQEENEELYVRGCKTPESGPGIYNSNTARNLLVLEHTVLFGGPYYGILSWYFSPELRATRDGLNEETTRFALTLVDQAFVIPNPNIPIPFFDEIKINEIKSGLEPTGNLIAAGIVNSIGEKIIDATRVNDEDPGLAGAVDVVLKGKENIVKSYIRGSTQGMPACNTNAQINCPSYKAALPVIGLHRQ